MMCMTCLFALTPAVCSAEETRGSTSDPRHIQYPAEVLRQDLASLKQALIDIHPNPFAYTSAPQFDIEYQAALRQLNKPMTKVQFYYLIAPLLASLKNGHTYAYPLEEEYRAYVKQDGVVFPLMVHWADRRLWLADSAGTDRLPLGSEILSIAGESAQAVVERYAHVFSAEGKTANYAMIERPEILWLMLWLDHPGQSRLRLRIRDPKRARRDIIVHALPHAIARQRLAKNRDEGRPYRYTTTAEPRCGLLTINAFDSLDAFQTFLQETFAKIQQDEVRDLIIDIRGCPGGDSRLCDALIGYLTGKPYRQLLRFEMKVSRYTYEKYGRELGLKEEEIGTVWSCPPTFVEERQPAPTPLRFTGRTYLLIGPTSFSSSAYLAGILKYYHIATLVGQETGDPNSVYGEVVDMRLPNTQLKYSIACKYFQFPGDTGDGRGIQPDHCVIPTPQDLAKKEDAVMVFTLGLIRSEMD
jgi:hypothetical protein